MFIKTRKENVIKLVMYYLIGLGVLLIIQTPINFYNKRINLIVYTVLFLIFNIGLYLYDKKAVKELNIALKEMKERLKQNNCK